MPPLGRDLVKYERIPSEEELPGGATRETLMQAWVEESMSGQKRKDSAMLMTAPCSYSEGKIVQVEKPRCRAFTSDGMIVTNSNEGLNLSHAEEMDLLQIIECTFQEIDDANRDFGAP